MSDNRENLKRKLQNKINEKKMKSGRGASIQHTQKLTTKEDIYNTTVSMINDCQLPQIKRLNVRQKFNALEKKYRNLKTQYVAIFRSVLNGELTMNNIGMLEMMLNMRETASYDEMNNFLAEKYKLDGDEESKPGDIDSSTAQKEFDKYVEKKD